MNKKLLGGSMITALGIVTIATILLMMQVGKPVIVDDQEIEIIEIKQKKWVERPLADADPGAGNTGYMYFMAYPHQAVPATAYASNLSNDSAGGGAYEFSDSWDTEMTNETPWGTTFDFVMKVRVNNTDGYNVSAWEDDWVRANLTVDFDYASDINDLAMTEVVIGTDGTTYRWYHYYANNGGSGYTITKGESYNCTAITFDVYE